MSTVPNTPGKFIVLEGLDGSGSTTQAGLLHTWLTSLQSLASEVFLTKEPSEGPAGAMIRMTLGHRLDIVDPHALALLFASDRLDHTQRDIVPKLEDGITVICDRYYLSNLAYRPRCVDLQWLRSVEARSLEPHLSILLDVPTATCIRRIAGNRFSRERFEEDAAELERVRMNYLDLIRELQMEGQNIHVVDGTAPRKEVAKQVNKLVRDLFRNRTAPTLHQYPLASVKEE
ncbi:MAG: dTMP kinase [Chloroflexi bacterium]|nr:dTMP kinase [Chloroflexota bacterium]